MSIVNELVRGSIYLSAKKSSLAEGFGTVTKLWLGILARIKLAKTFCMEFHVEVLSKNSGTMQFGTKFLHGNFRQEKRATITCRKFRLKILISERRCIDPVCRKRLFFRKPLKIIKAAAALWVETNPVFPIDQ